LGHQALEKVAGGKPKTLQITKKTYASRSYKPKSAEFTVPLLALPSAVSEMAL